MLPTLVEAGGVEGAPLGGSNSPDHFCLWHQTTFIFQGAFSPSSYHLSLPSSRIFECRHCAKLVFLPHLEEKQNTTKKDKTQDAKKLRSALTVEQPLA